MNTDVGTVDVLETLVDEHGEPLPLDDILLARAAADEMRQSVLVRVHHEVRTPLATLLGHVELLEECTGLPARLEASLRAISRSGDRLSELLAHLDELVGQPAE